MNKSLLNISDLNKEDIFKILRSEPDVSILEKKNIGLIFEKYSTRTRLSFNVAINNLGGNAIDIKFQDLNISRSETFEDTFKAMNCYLDGLVYRTSNHENLINASNHFHKPIINALSDISHPCQILSDLFTLQEHFGSLNCHILWMGDMNNVCFSFIEASNLIDELKFTVCAPKLISSQKKWNYNSNVSVINKIDEIDLNSINCVMTDVFVSMNDNNDNKKESLLEPYCVNSNIMDKTAKNSVFMHCLPANVGYEVTEEVFKSPKSIVWRQAYNRMVAQEKLLHFLYQ